MRDRVVILFLLSLMMIVNVQYC